MRWRNPCLTSVQWRQRKKFFHRDPLLKTLCAAILMFLLYLGIFGQPTYFRYPLEDAYKYADQLMSGIQPDIPPINQYLYPFIIRNEHKCKTKDGSREVIRLLMVIKSSVNHFEQRIAIRQTWGWEQRFPDHLIRRVFNLGLTKDKKLMQKVKYEQYSYDDIVQSAFVDTYFNNTIKTMMGFRWVMENCNNSDYVLFVDDDYYVSMKNVMSFISNPRDYPNNVESAGQDSNMLKFNQISLRDADNPLVDLFAGFTVTNGTPYRRPKIKWYVSQEEYPFAKYPSFITAGAMIMSFSVLRKMYYTSMYTVHFRFDDIYVGFLALKAGIQPLHNEHFYNMKKYVPNDRRFVITAHGYNASDMVKLWWEQYKFQQA